METLATPQIMAEPATDPLAQGELGSGALQGEIAGLLPQPEAVPLDAAEHELPIVDDGVEARVATEPAEISSEIRTSEIYKKLLAESGTTEEFETALRNFETIRGSIEEADPDLLAYLLTLYESLDGQRRDMVASCLVRAIEAGNQAGEAFAMPLQSAAGAVYTPKQRSIDVTKNDAHPAAKQTAGKRKKAQQLPAHLELWEKIDTLRNDIRLATTQNILSSVVTFAEIASAGKANHEIHGRDVAFKSIESGVRIMNMLSESHERIHATVTHPDAHKGKRFTINDAGEGAYTIIWDHAPGVKLHVRPRTEASYKDEMEHGKRFTRNKKHEKYDPKFSGAGFVGATVSWTVDLGRPARQLEDFEVPAKPPREGLDLLSKDDSTSICIRLDYDNVIGTRTDLAALMLKSIAVELPSEVKARIRKDRGKPYAVKDSGQTIGMDGYGKEVGLFIAVGRAIADSNMGRKHSRLNHNPLLNSTLFKNPNAFADFAWLTLNRFSTPVTVLEIQELLRGYGKPMHASTLDMHLRLRELQEQAPLRRVPPSKRARSWPAQLRDDLL